MTYTSRGYSLSISFTDYNNKKGKLVIHPIDADWEYAKITSVISAFENVSNARVNSFSIIVSWSPDSIIEPVQDTYISTTDKARLYYFCDGNNSYMELPAPVLSIFEIDEETVNIGELDALATALSLVMENTLSFISGKRIKRE